MSNLTNPIAIVGRSRDTVNYERAFQTLQIPTVTTLSISQLQTCSGLILPGGGDITPAFFGQKKAGSRNIDTELDILQLQALEYALRTHIPVLGICKGMQLINVYFGGTIVQHMPQWETHAYQDGDRYHPSSILAGSFLWDLYGRQAVINSAHHQCTDKLGKDLTVCQYAQDRTPEALCHDTLPVMGVQWHPERMLPFVNTPSTLSSGTDGSLLLSFMGGLASDPVDSQIHQ